MDHYIFVGIAPQRWRRPYRLPAAWRKLRRTKREQAPSRSLVVENGSSYRALIAAHSEVEPSTMIR